MIINEESNSQKKKTKQLDKFFGEKDFFIISKMTIIFQGMSLKESQMNVDVSHIHVKFTEFQTKICINAFQEDLTALFACKLYPFYHFIPY